VSDLEERRSRGTRGRAIKEAKPGVEKGGRKYDVKVQRFKPMTKVPEKKGEGK